MCSLKIPPTIKMVITDFDGVVTDNCVYIDEDCSMSRKLNFKDVMAFSLLRKNGILIAIISGEKNSAIELIAQKFEIKEIHQNIRNKVEILNAIIKEYSLSPEEYVYIGDDVNDAECLKQAKFKVTVPNAVQSVREIRGIQITEHNGGDGAFREVVDCLVNIS